MAELNEQQELSADRVGKARRSHGGLWFGVVILLIVIALAGAGFYLFMQLRDRQEGLGGEVKGEMSKQIADYQKQLVAIQSQLATLESTISGKDANFNKTLASFSELHNEKVDTVRKELNEAVQRIQRQLGKTRGDWLVADAEYLLSVANERLYLIGDVNTTREALEAADQRLRESGDAGVFSVREQIAKEVALLRTVSTIDTVGLYANIDSLQKQVDGLILNQPYAGKPPVASTAEPQAAETDQDTHEWLDSVLSGLHGVVTLRHTEHSVNEILTPEEAAFIREQLRIKLEMAKIALVQHSETVYRAALADAKTWLQAHFIENAASAGLLSELDKLATVNIRSHFPDISLSLKMLKDVTKLRIETDKAQPAESAPPKTAPALNSESMPLPQTKPVAPSAPPVQPAAKPEQEQ